MRSLISVTPLEKPAKAWSARHVPGATLSYQAYPGRLVIFELLDSRLTRKDVFRNGATNETSFELQNETPDTLTDVFALGENGACFLKKGELRLCANGRCGRRSDLADRVVRVVPRDSLTIELVTTSPRHGAYEQYAMASTHGLEHRGRTRIPLMSVFDFDDLTIEIFDKQDDVFSAWSATIRQPGRPERRIGGGFSAYSTLWFDGWLAVVSETKHLWLVPIARRSRLDDLLFGVFGSLGEIAGAEVVLGAKATRDRLLELVTPRLDGWEAIPFSTYSVRSIGTQSQKAWESTSLNSSVVNRWEFGCLDEGQTIILDPQPEPNRSAVGSER